MIKNLIFDVGGVILDDSIFSRNISKKSTVNKPSFRNCLLGRMKVEDYIDILKKDGRSEFEDLIFCLSPSNYEVNMPVISQTVELIYSLKKCGYKIYLFSNITEPTLAYLDKKNNLNECVDGGVYSFIEHMMKPDVRFYDRLIEKYKLDKKETIFFDDKLKNIEVGNSIGIKSVQFNSAVDVKKVLNI